MSRIVPLDNIPGSMPCIGKISAGYMDVKTTQGRAVTFPVKSRTLVFRCADPAVLRQAQNIVGGTVSKSPNPRAEGMWRLISEASELQVVIATDDRRDAPARYEAWGASGKLRDCDGRTCRFVIEAKSGERQDNVPCRCAAHDLAAEDPEACRITTRLNLVIPSFAAIPGVGVWQLESRGRTHVRGPEGTPRIVSAPRPPRGHGRAGRAARGHRARAQPAHERAMGVSRLPLPIARIAHRDRHASARVRGRGRPGAPPAPGRLGPSARRRAHPGAAGSVQQRAFRRSTHDVRNGEEGD
jgi:hypothetical protein